MKRISGIGFLSLFLILMFAACQPEIPVPKPRAYPKVNYPQKQSQDFKQDFCDFSFKYPQYTQIIQDTDFFGEAPVHPCWFDIYYPDFNSRIHCSYIPVTPEKGFEQLKSDAFELADWHNKKANYIEEMQISKGNVQGFIFDIEGPVASPFQFFLTDSANTHFFRGSLYFNNQVNPDSLAPIYEFIKADIIELINTFEWRP